MNSGRELVSNVCGPGCDFPVTHTRFDPRKEDEEEGKRRDKPSVTTR